MPSRSSRKLSAPIEGMKSKGSYICLQNDDSHDRDIDGFLSPLVQLITIGVECQTYKRIEAIIPKSQVRLTEAQGDIAHVIQVNS